MTGPDGFRAVLFDWDGTLVDSAERTYRCYVRVFSAYGIDYDHEDFERTYSPDWYRTYEHVGLAVEARLPRACSADVARSVLGSGVVRGRSGTVGGIRDQRRSCATFGRPGVDAP